MSPFIIVDGSSYFFRAFHALPPLVNSKGQPTGAIYGVANMIKRLIKDYLPTQMVVVFDSKGKTFRDELYPEYKAHRPPMPDDLESQFPFLVELLRSMGLPVLIIEGVEADDVIGTLALEAVKMGKKVLISTGDKDMTQLVNEHVTLVNTMTQQILDVKGVEAKFGVLPDQMIDYLALVGDSVDNVPGVPQCGPKTAVKWLKAYGTLEGVIKAADDMGGKIGESLRASLPHLPLSQQLVTIKTDVVLPVNLEALKIQPADEEALISLLKTLEFKSWLKEFSNETALTTAKQKSSHYQAIQDKAAWQTYFSMLKKQALFCIDTETTSLDPIEAEIVGISLAYVSHEAVYIPFMHQQTDMQLERNQILADLKPLLEDARILKIGQNLKYDYEVLQQAGIVMQGMAFDTMLESYVLNGSMTKHDMDTLALKYLDYKTITYEEVAGKGAKQLRFDQVPLEQALPYSAEDADITYQLHETLYPMLSDTQKTVLEQIEMPLVPVLAHMEMYGVLIDDAVLSKLSQSLKKKMAQLEEEAVALVGRRFNLQSPLQLQTILFEEQGLPIVSKTPTGQPSTSEAALQELAYTYRLPAVILDYRRLSKLVSTYTDALPKKIHPKTGRVHTSFNQAVTATGRLSSSDPNLQNIPIRREEGKLIRQAFIAPSNYKLVSADYSQIELRIMAHLSEDKRLCSAFANGDDIHAATAAEIFGVKLEEVTEEQRRRAKAVNFGLIYGMSAFGLSKQIGVERAVAEHYIKIYFERYPGVLDYMERTRKSARALGYVETLFGRRLYLPDIMSRNGLKRKAAERMAINAPMQGTAADLIKLAMIHLNKWQQAFKEKEVTMILQVHDELVFEVCDQKVEEAQGMIRRCMEEVVALSVPLKVSVAVGQNWDEAH